AIKVMAEISIDISSHTSKSLTEFLGREIDYVVTVCDNAKESCPFFTKGKKFLHKSFENPVNIIGSENEILDGFRRVRDQIKGWILNQFG
ncbi:MAG: arsenate reductase ArsC, partial [Candidatus Hodarchaeota archaeon]